MLLLKADGHRLYAAARDENIADALVRSGSLGFERLQAQLIKDALKPSMKVLDIGANIGYYTLMVARALRGTGQVYAFEPEPFNFRLLAANVKINGYNNVTLIRKAVCDSNREVTLFRDLDFSGGHSLWRDNVNHPSIVEHVSATTLDSFAENIQKVDMIKMDIEGAEGRAIRGGEKLLKEQHPALFIEISPRLLRHAGDDHRDLIELLESWGYKLSMIDESGQKVEDLDLRKLESHCKNVPYVNVMARAPIGVR
jgi:FkbM family methyltransferase